MPISSQAPIIGYVANGVTKSFAFPFAILSADDLKVKVGADVVTTGFSIAGVGDRNGGSVTFTDAPASSIPIILYREVTLDRTTDYQENGDLLAVVLDDDLDRVWMALQDQLLLADRALRSPIGETLAELPSAKLRSSKYLAFDSVGAPVLIDAPSASNASALALALADGSDPDQGTGMVGHDPVGPHAPGTAGAAIKACVKSASLLASAGAGLVGVSDSETYASGTVGERLKRTALDRGYAKTLPVTTLTPPTEFSDRLRPGRAFNGKDAVYLQDPYDLIDFTKNPDTTINNYYINYATGSDAAAGTSSGAAWKTFAKVVASAASPAIVHIEDEWIGVNGISNLSFVLTGNYKLKSAHASGKTRVCNMLEDYTKATFAWTNEGNGCWSTSEATTTATIFGRLGHASFDAKYPDEFGGAMPLQQAASSAACIDTPGTQYHDDVAKKKYIHLIDGRKPDPFDRWIYSYEVGGWNCTQGAGAGGVVLLENLQFYLNTGTGGNAGCRHRNTSSTTTNTARYGVKGCLSYGAAGNGFETYDAQVIAFSNSHARYNRSDNFNYHSFLSTGTKGAYITVYENNCRGSNPGFTGFIGQPSLGTSCNSSSAHDSMNIERMNSKHGGGNGATVADVNGCVSVNWCVDAGPSTGGDFDSCFWHDNTVKAGTYTGMYLWGCSAHDDGTSAVRLINNEPQTGVGADAGQVYVKYWRGQTDGAVTGTLKNWTGANI